MASTKGRSRSAAQRAWRAHDKITHVMTNVELSERQRELLLKTLEMYISTGVPVGSHALSEKVDAAKA